MKSGTWTRVTLVVLYALISVTVAGVWFHTSDEGEVLGKYSRKYFVAACLFTWMGIAAVPVAWLALTQRQIALPSGRKIVLSWRARLFGVGAAAVVLLVAAEVALTHWKAKQKGPRASMDAFHPFLQIDPVPGDSSKGINRWGFRGEDIERAKPAGTYRVFVLGGSTVFCGDTDFERSHCRLLEKQLRQAYPHARIEVQNAGFPWHCSPHALIKFLFKVQDFDPDLVITIQGFNDMLRSFSPPYAARGDYQPDYSHFNGPAATLLHEYANDKGRFRLHVVEEAQVLLGRQWFSDLRGAEPARKVEVKPVTEWKSLPAFERNMRDLVAVIRSKNIDLILGSQPYLYKDPMTAQEKALLVFPDQLARNEYEKADVPSLARGLEEFNRINKVVADQAGVVFVDLERRLPKTPEYFTDDAHFTAKGNEVIGEAFAEAILAQGFVEKKFPRAHP